ncbi:D-2-hydroxyacid dehydrogenase [Sphaerochaeta sp. PS]|uniref:D-2-hydroxyacid dehydrogenase n=1 Tax=Sphaerochaeta sp. PS TaxID=3076336 RepID=UPI0028A3134F|nr:D-2-hydroxyacid dehydrogenase [Sphaerochaeta sp. PS]MDT4763045.1 D-2-hydroxyacid dehydrogenase [Sphaerochaeta sp. PS]
MKKIETLFLHCSHFNPTEAEISFLKTTYPQLSITSTEETAYTAEQIEKAEIIVGFPRAEDLPKAKNLKWLQAASAGVLQYADKGLYVNKDCILTTASGTYGRQIGDHVLGMIIAFNHQFLTYHNQMKTKIWARYFPTNDIWESTILIIGFGDIGQNVARLAKAYGMRVIALKRTPTDKPAYVDELLTVEHLDRMLPTADYVVVCTASTPETEKIIDARRIGLMKQGSYIINVARGSLVDQEAVIEALEKGKLGGAGFDATEPEPLPPENKLWSLPNVLITPHSSGLSPRGPSKMFSIFADNLKHYLTDKNMKNIVDFERKY